MAQNIDINQLLAALQAQAQQVRPPQYRPQDVQGMYDDAEYDQFRALEQRSKPFIQGNSGMLSMAAQMGRNRLAEKRDRSSLDKLKQAYGAQSGIDQYAAQIQALQARAAELEKEQLARDRYSYEQGISQTNDMAKEQFKVDNRVAPKPEKPDKPSYGDFLDDDGATYKHVMNPDGSMGQRVGMTKPAPPKETEASGKDLDISEALGVLDNVETMLSDIPSMSGTGPIQGYASQFTEWNQQFQAETDHLFAVAKRIYKTKGEGQFSDADAAALQGMLTSSNRNETVNLAIIKSLRKSLASRSPNFQQFMDEVSGIAGDTDDEAAETSSDGQVFENDKGERIKWNGQTWVTVQ